MTREHTRTLQRGANGAAVQQPPAPTSAPAERGRAIRASPRPEAVPALAIPDAIRREAAAWIQYVQAAVEYWRTTAEMPEAVLDTLRPFRRGLDEAVETGRLLGDLSSSHLIALAAEVTAVDHAEIRRCARARTLTRQATPSLATILTAALLRGVREGP